LLIYAPHNLRLFDGEAARPLRFFVPGSLVDPAVIVDIAARAERLLTPVVETEGYRLLLCEYVGGGRGRILRVYIERADDTGVSLDDCIRVNNLVTDVLDVEDIIPTAYNLEVSSPGVERPLKRTEHFEAVLGKLVRIKSWEPIIGRRNWLGPLISLDDDILTVEVDGEDHRIPIPAIERANLVYEPPQKGQKKGGSGRKSRARKR
jgi:ribosome maturation factor RimP